MSNLTVGDIREAIKLLPDDAPVFNDVVEGPDEWTAGIVSVEGTTPQHWQGAANAEELPPALWLHVRIYDIEEDHEDSEGEG